MTRLCLALLVVLSLTVAIDAQRKPAGGSAFADFEKAAPLPGDPAPRLHCADTEGKVFDLREAQGAWVVIEFGSYT